MTFPSASLSPTERRAARALTPLCLVTAFSLFLAVFAHVLYLMPIQDELTQIIDTYDQARRTQMRNQWARRTQEQLGVIWQRLPARKDFTSFSVAISQLANDNKITIPGMTYDLDPLEDGLATKGHLSFEAVGAYEFIRHFIYELETAGPYLFIEKLSASRAKKTDDVSFKIQVATFLKADQPGLQTGD